MAAVVADAAVTRFPWRINAPEVLLTLPPVIVSWVPSVKEPAPIVQVAALADSAIDIAVRPWVRVPDLVAATGEINKALVETLAARGLAHPFPRRELRVLPGASDGEARPLSAIQARRSTAS